MKTLQHSALIHVSLDLVGGLEKARDLLSRIMESGEISSISSIYKRYLTKDRVDLNACMEFVFKFDTVWGVDQCLQMTKVLGAEELTILTFDDSILMSPRLTLPFPRLHQDPLIIRCAAEAWGQYEHPIYQKSLSEISRTAPQAEEAEFHMQGKSVLDF